MNKMSNKDRAFYHETIRGNFTRKQMIALFVYYLQGKEIKDRKDGKMILKYLPKLETMLNKLNDEEKLKVLDDAVHYGDDWVLLNGF